MSELTALVGLAIVSMYCFILGFINLLGIKTYGILTFLYDRLMDLLGLERLSASLNKRGTNFRVNGILLIIGGLLGSWGFWIRLNQFLAH